MIEHAELIRDVETFLAFERNDTLIAEIDALTVAIEVRRDDEAILLPNGDAATRIAWGVWVDGFRMGGRHYDYLAALTHAARCSWWTPKQHAEWIALNRALGVRAVS